MSHIVKCAKCAKVTELAREGRFCSDPCRTRYHRETLIVQRERLATAVNNALLSGDLAALETVAHTARLLAVQRRALPPLQAVS